MKETLVREPEFKNMLDVLERKAPARPVLYELFLNETLYARLAKAGTDSVGGAGSPGKTGDRHRWEANAAGRGLEPSESVPGFSGPRSQSPFSAAGRMARWRMIAAAMRKAGYDYAPDVANDFKFPKPDFHSKDTLSLNEGASVTDRRSFKKYAWPDPNAFDYSTLSAIESELPEGMRLIVLGPCGVLENAIQLVGFDRLCYLLADDRKLAGDIFDAIGSRLVGYYQRCLAHDAVGAIVGNDDWGFKTQTMLSPRDMREFVFPWHKQIVAAAHEAGRPAILHSCGNLREVMGDIVEDMEYDAKHSFEDIIQPVEEAYEEYGGRIAIMGGMDVDFICRSTPDEVRRRSRAMLERAAGRGGYALGTGNSVPEWLPEENYFAMTSAALEG
jgi:uroporphyrinogen decarboxylase